MTRKSVFYTNLIIEEADIPRAEAALGAKGIEKHIIIKEKLRAWNNEVDVEYTKIASTYRYDKRLRFILFKYISYLEEHYRSILLDEYASNSESYDLIKYINEKLTSNGNDLNNVLEDINFSLLIRQIQKLPDSLKEAHSIRSNIHSKSNFKALITLRNAVMHNKFLLLYRGYDKCYVQGVDNSRSANLKANILNLIEFLPEDVGIRCRDEINLCSQDRNKENDTKWDLPPAVVVKLDGEKFKGKSANCI